MKTGNKRVAMKKRGCIAKAIWKEGNVYSIQAQKTNGAKHFTKKKGGGLASVATYYKSFLDIIGSIK